MGAQASVKTSSQFATSGYRAMLGIEKEDEDEEDEDSR